MLHHETRSQTLSKWESGYCNKKESKSIRSNHGGSEKIPVGGKQGRIWKGKSGRGGGIGEWENRSTRLGRGLWVRSKDQSLKEKVLKKRRAVRTQRPQRLPGIMTVPGQLKLGIQFRVGVGGRVRSIRDVTFR